MTFRNIIGLRKYSKGQIWDAWMGLLRVHLELNKNKAIEDDDKETAMMIMKSMMQIEFPRRMALRELYTKI